MYALLNGYLLSKNTSWVIVECQGVGYEVNISNLTYKALPNLGEPVLLYTWLRITEDAHQLYGFAHPAEKRLFLEIIKVNRVGPSIALAILSTFDFNQLINIVKMKDVKLMTTVPGVGKASAERLILELNNKMEALLAAVAAGRGEVGQLQQALATKARLQSGVGVVVAPTPVVDFAAPTLESEFTITLDTEMEVAVTVAPEVAQATQALVSLGLKEALAQNIVAEIYQEGMEIPQLVRQALELYKSRNIK